MKAAAGIEQVRLLLQLQPSAQQPLALAELLI